MTSFARRLLGVLLTLSATACLDLKASVVEKVVDDGGPGTTDQCLKCLNSPFASGTGCAEQLAGCNALSLCARGVECTFEEGCYNRNAEELPVCIRTCADRVGFRTIDAPETMAALLWYECATNRCRSECGQGIDAGPDGSTPDADAPDGATGDATSDGGGACTNPADQTRQAEPDFAGAVRACGFSCFGMSETCNAQCVEAKGITSACATCWGDSVNCGTKNCIGQCLNATSPDCLACTAQFCDPAFHACAGM
jgi:hypothetical protein